MTNEVRCWCRHCKAELSPDHKGPCPKCGKLGKDCKVSCHAVVEIHSTIKVRQKRKGFRKFIKEILQGRFPSGSPKLKKGVDKVRVINKEKDEYHETITDASTGVVIHDRHEPLSQHKSKQQKAKKK